MNNIAQNTKITTTQINTLISEIDGKLNLSGGDITGRVTFKLNSNVGGALGVNPGPCLRITGGGWSAAESGAYIQLYPKESPETTSYAGNVRIVAQDGTNSSTLDIKPTYMQYSNYLQFNNGAISQIRKSNNDSYLEITGGTNSTNSSYLVLYGGNASDDKGHFGLTAYDGNSKHQLYGSAYGTLTWGGNSVLHTNNISTHAQTIEQQLLSNGWVEIPENADLNNYMTPGLYVCGSNSTVATLKNCPTSTAFELIITPRHTRQHLRHYNAPGEFVRYYQTWGETGWKSWTGMYVA
mgnify:CR=1 FL=1